MKNIPFLAIYFCVLTTSVAQAQSSQPISDQAERILIRNIHIIDVVSGQTEANMDVLLSTGIIQSVSPSKESETIEAGVEIIDGTGKYLTPGLVDAHVHFFQNGGLYTRPDAIDLRAIKPYEEELAETWTASEDFMHRYLAAGITSVCDVGGPMKNYDIRRLADSLAKAPEVYVTGPLISTYAPEALNTADAPIIKVTTAEEAREMVRKQVPFDPDFIKIWFIVFPGQNPEDNQELVRATIEESHLHGIPVAVHATQLETARLSVKLGADILVHSVQDKVIDDEFVELLIKNDVSYIPTLVVGQNYGRVFRGDPLMTSAEFTLANPFVLGSLMDLRHLPETAIPSWIRRLATMPDQSAQEMDIMSENLATLFDAGVNVVMGTDAGNLGTQHASSFYPEWDAMRAAGLSHAQILTSSTFNAARMLSKEAETGQVLPGMKADLVIWDTSPVESGPHFESIHYVFRRGIKFQAKTDLLPQTPEVLAQRQLNAYNARNLDAFLGCYHDSVQIYRFPEVLLSEGKEAMAKSYGPMFENTPMLHCELLNRTIIGDKVIDEESVNFGGDRNLHALAIYEFQDGLIKKVTFIQ